MIIEVPAGRRDKKHSFHALNVYITDAKKVNHNREKTLFTGTRNIESLELNGLILEMTATAAQNNKVMNPVFHAILSWRQGETPTREQVEECVDLYLKEMGMEQCQVFYGLHKNTDNMHLHLSINRIDPETYYAIQPAAGWWKKANERVARQIEIRHGWEIEQSGRYIVLDREQIIEKRELPMDEKALPSKAKDFENTYAEKSALRVAKERASDIIKNGQTWLEIQESLAKNGMKLERKGSGLLLWVGDIPVKASNVNQQFGYGKLKKRLGEYDLEGMAFDVSERHPEPLRNTPLVREYTAKKKTYYEEKKRIKLEERKLCTDEWVILKEQQAAARKQMYLSAGSWRGRGMLLNAMRKVQAMEQQAERDALKKSQKERSVGLLGQYSGRFPAYKLWLINQGKEREADVWRYRDSLPGVLAGAQSVPPEDNIIATKDLCATAMTWRGQISVGYTKQSRLVLVDSGDRIDVLQWRDRQNVLASLKLAHEKWGSASVHGSKAYVDLCIQIAAEEGIELRNYRKEVRDKRMELMESRGKAQKLDQPKHLSDEVAVYCSAVSADRYRVTAIKNIDGQRKAWTLGKERGIVTDGFSAAEIREKLPYLQKLDDSGKNLYFTPISDNKNHILIDDMSKERLEKLIEDGHAPVIVLETSPGNYQAIINIPKIDAQYNHQVSNMLMKELNAQYGDAKISGVVHPHRMPSTHNHKGKYRADDGSSPVVRIIAADGGICQKTRELAVALHDKAIKKDQQLDVKMKNRAMSYGDMPGDTVSAYFSHVKNILVHVREPINWNQVDSMAALRLYATGHDLGAIQSAIEAGAPQIRPEDMRSNHQWPDYAKRTTKYVESLRGQQQLDQLRPKFLGYWYYLEGRKLRDKTQERGIQR